MEDCADNSLALLKISTIAEEAAAVDEARLDRLRYKIKLYERFDHLHPIAFKIDSQNLLDSISCLKYRL